MDLTKVTDFVKEQLKNEKTGHDFYHGQRVAHLASKMYLQDNPDAHEDSRMVAIIQTAGYLHDTIDEKICMSFSANIEHHYQLPVSGEYVQDADRIESLGAIGIARAFTYGGAHGNVIYDPRIKPQKLVSHEQYREHTETTINHFYEKLFHLADLMNTAGGKKEAQKRTEFMRDYVKEFMTEWNV